MLEYDYVFVSISHLRFFSLIACVALSSTDGAMCFNLTLEILFTDRCSGFNPVASQNSFNLTLEILFTDRHSPGSCKGGLDYVSISHLRFFSLIGHSVYASHAETVCFNLTLEILFTDRKFLNNAPREA